MTWDASKQKKLDDLVKAVVAKEDVHSEEYNEEGSVKKKSKTHDMMDELQGELTEARLDDAMYRAMAARGAALNRGADLLGGPR